MFRSKCQNNNGNDKPSKFFLHKDKQKAVRNSIFSLTSNTCVELTDIEDILNKT